MQAPDLVAPAFLSIPHRDDSLGDLAVGIMVLCGITLDPEQALALDAMLSTIIDEDGLERFAHLEAAIVQGRQNGKTGGVLLPIALLCAIRRPDQLIVWSAHRYKITHEAFLAMVKLVTTVPELAARVSKVSYSNGEESFEFQNGSRIIFVARSQAQGRGLSGDVVILDEALFLTAEMMGALLPTLSARPDPLVIYASSAGLSTSTVLFDVRERGRAGGDPSLVYVEWTAPEDGCASKDCDHHRSREGCALDDPANWRLTNPALVRGRITERYVRSERRALDAAEFARERCGWWEKLGAGGMFHLPSWWKRQEPETRPTSKLSLAIHVTPDRSWSAVAVASMRADGVIHGEVIAHREGTSWLLPYVTERLQKRRYQSVTASTASVGGLSVDLARLRSRYVPLNGSEVRRACSGFFDLVVADDKLAVRPHPELDEAVRVARRSSLRGEWVFAADDGVDLSTLYALALAVAAARAKPRPRTDDELLASSH